MFWTGCSKGRTDGRTQERSLAPARSGPGGRRGSRGGAAREGELGVGEASGGPRATYLGGCVADRSPRGHPAATGSKCAPHCREGRRLRRSGRPGCRGRCGQQDAAGSPGGVLLRPFPKYRLPSALEASPFYRSDPAQDTPAVRGRLAASQWPWPRAHQRATQVTRALF